MTTPHAALVEALSFYADPKRYQGPNNRQEEPDKFSKDAGLDHYLLDVTRDGGCIARAALAQAEAAQPVEPVWISVEDRLPAPDSGEVLVWLSGGMYALDEWHTHREDPIGMSTTHTLDMGCMWRTFDFEEVTHWMPLPAAPKP